MSYKHSINLILLKKNVIQLICPKKMLIKKILSFEIIIISPIYTSYIFSGIKKVLL